MQAYNIDYILEHLQVRKYIILNSKPTLGLEKKSERSQTTLKLARTKR